MTNQLKNKVALITGGSRGIGRAAALQFARQGAKLIAIHYGSDAERAAETVKEINALGSQAIAIQANLSAGKQAADQLIAEFKARALELTGDDKLDILVNNAGVAPAGPISGTTQDQFDEVMTVNFKAPYFIIQGALPHLRDNGHLVNVSTGFTRVASSDHPLYAASKGALETLTLALAPEFARRGITINAIMPGVTETDMNKAWINIPEAREGAAGMSVFNRIGRPEDVAELITYLSSDAARWTTGQVVDVSGGAKI
jgi:3-oxoacyl-[acyl-carrier protein] reductase